MNTINIIAIIIIAMLLFIALILKKRNYITPLLFSFFTAIIIIVLNQTLSKNNETDLSSIQSRQKISKEIAELKAENKKLTSIIEAKDFNIDQLKKLAAPLSKETIEPKITKTEKPYRKSANSVVFHESIQFNYRLNLDKDIATQLKVNTINAEADSSWRFKKALGFGLIIVENIQDLGFSDEELSELSLVSIKQNTTSFERVKKETVKVGAGEFKTIHIKAKLNNIELYYVFNSLVRHGMHYQIVTWIPSSLKSEKFINASYECLHGFEIIDPTWKPQSSDPSIAKNYNDPKIGINLENKISWKPYDLNEDLDTFPSYGGTLEDGPFLFYSGYIPEKYSNEDILSSCLNLYQIANDQIPPRKGIKKISGLDIHSMTQVYNNGHGICHSRLELVRKGNRMVLIRIWAWQKDQLLDTTPIWNSFRWTPPIANEQPAQFNDIVKCCSAKIINQIGLMNYDKQMFLDAQQSFKEAANLDVGNESYLRNTIQSYIQIGKTTDALKLTNEVIAKSPIPSNEILEYKARILYLLGKLKDAEVAYGKIFDRKHKNDPIMQDYLSLLIDQSNFKKADLVSTKYYSTNPSIKTQGWMGFMQMKNSRIEEAEATFIKILQNMPNDVFTLENIIELYTTQKNFDKAIKYADQWIKEHPSDTKAKISKISIMTTMDNKAKAYDYAKKLSTEQPNNQKLKIELAKLSSTLGLGDHSLINEKITPVSLNQKLVAEIQKPVTIQPEQNDNIICQYSVTSILIKKSGEINQTVRSKYKILNLQGVQEYSKHSIPFNPTSEKIYINELKVYDKEGKITYTGKPRDYYITDKDKEMATHEKVVHAQVKSLALGSSYEITYTIQKWKYDGLFPYSSFWFIQKSHLAFQAVSIVGEIKDLAIEASQGLQLLENSVNSITWVKRDIQKFRSESFSPEASRTYSLLSIGSNKQKWKDVSSQYFNHISEKYEARPEIKALVENVTKKESSQQQKLADILQWIQTNITYQAIEFGPRGRMPKSADQTITTKEGDCKDMSLLLLHMLREIGIEAHLALAHTDQRIVTKIPSEDQFNHVVIYCPSLQNKVIDPTYNYLNLINYSPYTLTDNHILPIMGSGSELYTIPPSSVEHVQLNINRELSVNKTHILLKETTVLKGFAASYYRRLLAGKNDKELIQYLTYLFGSYYPEIEITNASIDTGLKNNYTPLKITIHARKLIDGNTVKVPMLWETNYFLLERIVDRKLPLFQQFNIVLNSITNIAEPDKFNISAKNFDSKYCSYEGSQVGKILKMRSERKRCEGEASEYEILRNQSNKLIPTITLKTK